MHPTVLVAIADGSEEMEAVIAIDLLRRAGMEVTVASCAADGRHQISASRGVQLVADCAIDDTLASNYDLIVLPGGMPGSEQLRDCATLAVKLKQQRNHRRWIAAICAAPAVCLQPLGLIDGAQVTCHPHFHSQIDSRMLQADQAVVVDHDHNLVTSQGPGTAFSFALTLIALLLGEAKAAAVRGPLAMIES